MKGTVNRGHYARGGRGTRRGAWRGGAWRGVAWRAWRGLKWVVSKG